MKLELNHRLQYGKKFFSELILFFFFIKVKMFSIQLVERSGVQDKTVEQIATECPSPGWITTFEKGKPEIELVSSILVRIEPWFPLKKHLFRALDLCPLVDVKIVILGQDPYHSVDKGTPQANGLAFSTDKCHPVQPSLKNIYSELVREYPENVPGHKRFVPPNHGDLSKWASQGVLLLNTCLTVAPHQAGSHKEIWNGFMTRIIDSINDTNPECIFLLWGAKAIDFSQRLGQRAIKLNASHPSPYSAHRGSKDVPAFIGCNHFVTANQYLINQNKIPIDWTLD
jgi:uracil-DNA glycosylase